MRGEQAKGQVKAKIATADLKVFLVKSEIKVRIFEVMIDGRLITVSSILSKDTSIGLGVSCLNQKSLVTMTRSIQKPLLAVSVTTSSHRSLAS